MQNEERVCLNKELLARQTAVRLSMQPDTVSDVLDNLLTDMRDAFERGQCVDLGSDFGRFSVKFNKGYCNMNSPRTPKAARYTVVFKSANDLKKRLKADAEAE